MDENMSKSESDGECESLYNSFTQIFEKVAYKRATPSRLQRLVSTIQRIMCESKCKKVELTVGGSVIGAFMVDCLCCPRPQASISTSGSSMPSSRCDSSDQESSEVILRCMYALSHVLRQCKGSLESPFMRSFVDCIVSRLEDIGHAIGRIPPEHVYESERIKRILYLWRQEGVLKGTDVVRRLLVWHAKINKGKTISTSEENSRACHGAPLLEEDIFEKRMKFMEYASSRVMYMKHPVILCD